MSKVVFRKNSFIVIECSYSNKHSNRQCNYIVYNKSKRWSSKEKDSYIENQENHKKRSMNNQGKSINNQRNQGKSMKNQGNQGKSIKDEHELLEKSLEGYGHTHLRSLKNAKDAIRFVEIGRIPTSEDIRFMESLIRISTDKEYIRRLEERIAEIKLFK